MIPGNALLRISVTFATLCFVVSCQSAPQSHPAPTPLTLANEINEIVETAIQDLEVVPGFALAIYTPEGTYARGFGVTDIETGEPVSADTAFYIASTTKAFTGLAMNILHHRGALNLDMSIAKFAPDLNLPLGLSSDIITLRDLLTHTHGLNNEPLGFRSAFTGQHSPDVDWRLLETDTEEYVEAPHGTFRYSNAGYNILTTLTDRKLGTLWQDLLAREIFEPVGMTRTSARRSDATRGNWSVAAPHLAEAWPKNGDFEAGVRRFGIEKNDGNMQSAGGMFMSANDALLWLELLVEEGEIDSRQIIPAEIIRGTRAELVEVGTEGGGYTRDFYGLGWNIGMYRDNAIVSHGGGFAGYSTRISYMPDRKIGVASFANESNLGSALPVIINNYIYDRLTGRRNARQRVEERIARLARRGERLRNNAIRERRRRAKRDWALTQPFETYTGTYTNETWGTLQVTGGQTGLSWTFGELNGVAEPFPQEDTTRVEIVPGNGTVAQFTLTDTGEVSGVNIITYDELSWFRNTSASASTELIEVTFSDAERDQIVGTYIFEALDVSMEITEENGAFFVQVTGQDRLQITPLSKDTFIHASTGSRGQFIADETGRITRLLWEQAGQSFEGEKAQ